MMFTVAPCSCPTRLQRCLRLQPSTGRRSSQRQIAVHADAYLKQVATGIEVPLTSEAVIVGSDGGAEAQVSGTNIAGQHARVELRGGRVFCKALVGDGSNFLADTYTWMLPDTQLRPAVDYMLSPGCELSFGELGSNVWSVEFKEQETSSAMADMLLDGMVQGAKPEVQDALRQRR